MRVHLGFDFWYLVLRGHNVARVVEILLKIKTCNHRLNYKVLYDHIQKYSITKIKFHISKIYIYIDK